MNIEQAQPILAKEQAFKRTPSGRPIQEKALDTITATIQDVNNYSNQVVQCVGCGFVISILLTENGCPNCGVEDLKTNIQE